MSEPYDVIVIGGGVVGLTAAIAMRKHRFSVAVMDAGSMSASLTQPDLRVYAINAASQALFQSLNVWEQLDVKRISPYQHMHVWDASNQAYIDFDARMIARDKLGDIIEESVVKHALLKVAEDEGVTLFPNHKAEAVEVDTNGVQVESGTSSIKGNLLIVADGANSPTRKQLGVEITSWPYHQHAVVATVSTEKPHQNTAYQVFNSDGPLAFLPLNDPHQCSIVWSTRVKKAEHLVNISSRQFNEQLQDAFASTLGSCSVLSTRHHFPLIMRHAKQYSGTRFLLMGDAAHTIHPLAGLGLNVGLADIAALIAILERTHKVPWTRTVLGAYQRDRKYHVWQTIALMQGLKSLFIKPFPPVQAVRGLGLKLCNDLPFLKRFLVEQATGIAAMESF